MRTHHLREKLPGNSPLREVGITYPLQRREFLSERLLGDNHLVNFPKLCSHNFSEKTSVRGSIRAGISDGMADCESEGWGQGLEPWGTGPAHAINDSHAEFNLSVCPIHLHQASPGEQKAGEGQTFQRPWQGCQILPRGAQGPQPQARRGTSRTNNRGSQMPEVSEHIQLDNQSGLPLVRLQASPGECLQKQPSAARPILAVSYLCPTETYKAAQQASVCCQVQSGRKRSRGYMHTCQTCLAKTPPPGDKRDRKHKTERLLAVPHFPSQRG